MISKPEWGLNVSKKNLPALSAFSFEKAINALPNKTDG